MHVMPTGSIDVGKIYRLNLRDVFVDRKSPAPSGGYTVHWKSDDGGPSVADEWGEAVFQSQAELLVELDDPIILTEQATTFRRQIGSAQATGFRVSGTSLSGPYATTHSATIWSGSEAIATYPISATTYAAVRGTRLEREE